jgi:hypothetical protein
LQTKTAIAEFRGSAAPSAKSEPFTFVSVQALPLRKMACVAVGAGAGVPPSAQLAGPYEARSKMDVAVQVFPASVAVLASATFPPVGLIAMVVEIDSGVGKAAPVAPPPTS